MHRSSPAAALLAGAALCAVPAAARADAKALLARYSSRVTAWDGPTTGPKAASGKTVVVLAGDMKKGGILGVTNGIAEAAEVTGWTVRILDGAGSVSGRTAAFDQALTLKPDGIVVDGFDAVEQKPGLDAAQAAGIPVVAWHAGPEIGVLKDGPVRVNVSTDPMLVSDAAADWAFVDTGGKPPVVIFTDSQYAIALAKTNRMKAQAEKLGGTVLSFGDAPIAETSNRRPQLTTSLLQRLGARWTDALAIDDISFDFMGPSLDAAGDGSESAYQRVRAGDHQSVTAAEPLLLQGRQLVDELNRAFAHQPPSGYVAPFHLVTKENIAYDGGPKNMFDPDDGYRAVYTRIWTGR